MPTWIDLSTDGPLAATVADLVVLLELEAGPTAGDPSAQTGWRLGPLRLPRRLLAAPRLVAGPDLHPSVSAGFDVTLRRAEAALGLPIESIDGPVLRSGDADTDWFTMAMAESLDQVGRSTVERALAEDLLEAGFARWMRLALEVRLDDYLAARRRRSAYVRELDDLLGEDALLLTPTLAVPGWSPWGVVAGREAEAPGLPADVINTAAQNLAGHPALSVPAGRLAEGLPFGLQVTGPRFREDLVLGFGAAWEAACPWPLVADGYPVFGEGA